MRSSAVWGSLGGGEPEYVANQDIRHADREFLSPLRRICLRALLSPSTESQLMMKTHGLFQ